VRTENCATSSQVVPSGDVQGDTPTGRREEISSFSEVDSGNQPVVEGVDRDGEVLCRGTVSARTRGRRRRAKFERQIRAEEVLAMLRERPFGLTADG
jgi:hypothetical protein